MLPPQNSETASSQAAKDYSRTPAANEKAAIKLIILTKSHSRGLN